MLRFARVFRFLACWVLLLLQTTAHATTTTPPQQQESDGDNGEHALQEEEKERWAEFKTWAERHERNYESQIEEAKRFTIWMENDDKIKSHNSQIPPPSWTMGHNKFSDLTHKEFAASVGLIELPSHHHHHRALEEQIIDSNVTIEEVNPNLRSSRRLGSVDWRDYVIVKNQGSCGSCWAFSTTGAIEAFYKIKKSQTIDLAEQHLVDCSKKNYGCNGGWPEKAISFVATSGIASQTQYPYTAKSGTCKAATGATKVGGVKKIAASSSALQTALNDYPVSVCVDASDWKLYASGVFSDCGSTVNHAVLAVGYDSNGHWLIKNSWGTDWGDEGFITLESGDTCGILKSAVQPY